MQLALDPHPLDPRQADAVRTDFAGPAWLTGPPGTGKTLVALHRLARIGAQRSGRLLYTAPSAALAHVQSARYRRLFPGIPAEFASLSALARDLLLRRGRPTPADDETVIAAALAEVRRLPLPQRYASVVADEAHDLSPAALRFVHALAGDSLLLTGDVRRSADPGAAARRSQVLHVNYRTAAAVLAVAGPGAGRGHRPGGHAEHYVAACAEDHDSELVNVLRHCRIRPGGIAVLTDTAERAVHYRRLLHQCRIPVAALADATREPAAAVTVGTVRRARGMEFPAVFLPGHRRAAGQAALVAVTRARDFLWTGHVLIA
ncbi:MAG: UvrD-like helicase C-terminal domain/UvrD/REP helicase N-terminal domain [Actinomycetia bacterium]|jgi:hypothetical protein|nr:UvrD-like helicase C-terminal domain/UvrD/REP helicase N-terminal domain [Actinomycetes bacterium]